MAEKMSSSNAFGRTTHARAAAWAYTTHNAIGSIRLHATNELDTTLTELEAILHSAMCVSKNVPPLLQDQQQQLQQQRQQQQDHFVTLFTDSAAAYTSADGPPRPPPRLSRTRPRTLYNGCATHFVYW
ncbi:unnamed protein product [Ixodes hexagonus]